jgi:hypothetical protein
MRMTSSTAVQMTPSTAAAKSDTESAKHKYRRRKKPSIDRIQ